MPDTDDGPTPPADLSSGIADALGGSSVHDLRLAIIYAQELLQETGADRPSIEARPGEAIISVREREGHTEVLKRVPCGEECDACPHGPYLYHVRSERHPDGSDHLHWVFIGQVYGDEA